MCIVVVCHIVLYHKHEPSTKRAQLAAVYVSAGDREPAATGAVPAGARRGWIFRYVSQEAIIVCTVTYKAVALGCPISTLTSTRWTMTNCSR